MKKIGKQDIRDILALTPMQEGLLFQYLKDPGVDRYFAQLCLEISGEIDIRCFTGAWDFVVNTHETLRTVFRWEELENPVQVILAAHELRPGYYDLSDKSGETRKNELENLKVKDRRRISDLERVPFRVSLVRTGERQYVMILSNHHILYDGWSNGIILNEFFNAYDALCRGRGWEIPVKTGFKEFVRHVQNRDKYKQEEYWRAYLKGFDTHTGLSVRQKRKGTGIIPTGTYQVRIESEVKKALEDFVKGQEITPASLFYGAWGILLQRYAGSGDVVFGTTVSGRSAKIQGIEEMVGLFINTLPLRVRHISHEKTARVLKQINNTLHSREAYETVSPAKIKEYSEIEHNQELFDTLVTIENYPLDLQLMKKTGDRKLTVDSYSIIEATHYDLAVGITVFNDIEFIFTYNREFYEEESIKRLARHLRRIMEDMVENPGKAVSEIEMLTPEEKKTLLFDFNNTAAEYPRDKTLQELFGEQVERTPDHIAVKGAHELHELHEISITYSELDGKSDRLAHLLREKGILADSIVAIMMGRSVEMIIGILGILKAGGAYLPIDPDYPQERIDFMLKDSGAKILLTSLPEGRFIHHSSHQFIIHHSDCLAYVLYTSGSTGRPKGVMVRHASVVNFIYSMYRGYNFDFGPPDHCLSLTNFCFDVSVCEVFMPLVCGARVVVLSPGKIFDPGELAKAIVNHSITFAYIPPGLLKAVCEYLKFSGAGIALNKMLVGVEPINDDILEEYMELNPLLQIINGYGPTEAAICAAVYKYESHEPEGSRVPIGGPLANTWIVLLDRHDHLVPVGVPGELCIAGDGLARGYLNDPELTKQKFCGGPGGGFSKEPPGRRRHYKTGDLARRLPDGNLEFIGRIDNQVKIRGYRIELGEIESVLLKHENIQAAVVSAKEMNLCAYFIAGIELSVPGLREYLAGYLPGYMIPSYFVQLETIPLTPNGKIDRKALPEPGTGVAVENYEAPGSDVEKKLVDVWQEVLGVRGIGIWDNFFELGGDSIKAVQVSSRLQKHGLKMEIRDLFLNPVIKRLGKHIKPSARKIDQGPVTGEVPLTPIQRWFFETDPVDCFHFNQAVMLYRESGFDEAVVAEVFGKIAEHHDALRMVYRFESGRVIQENRGTQGRLFHLEVINVGSDVEIEKEAGRIQRGINLTAGPLVHLGLFKTNRGDHLLVVIHHLVIDGVSWRILLEDFAVGYRQVLNGEAICFQRKTDAFKDWAQELASYGGSGKLLKELDSWKQIEEVEVPALPGDFEIPRHQGKVKNSVIVGMVLDGGQTRSLLRDVHRAYGTEINDILLTALALAVRDWCTNGNVLIALESHGREEIINDMDISRTVGWFTGLYPVLLDISRVSGLPHVIKHIKETLRRIPDRGIGYGILKYLTPGDKRKGVQLRCQPEISFNYLGQLGQEWGRHSDIFQRSPLKTGNPVSPGREFKYAVDINGMIRESGELALEFSFNRYEYRRSSIEKLADFYRANLVKIIDHCTRKEKPERTPSDFTYPYLSIVQLEALTREKGDIEDIYVLTPMQAGMLFHWLAHKDSAAYFEQAVISIRGHIDKRLLEKGFNCLVREYDVLRTVFYHENPDRPVQIVLKQREGKIHFEDISHLGDREQGQYLEAFRLRDRDRGFDLGNDMLIRVSLLKTGEDAYRLVWSFHHILMDGWCLGIIYGEFIRLYRLLVRGEAGPLELAPVNINRYVDYIKWQERQDKQEGLNYWQTYLEGYEVPAVLPGCKKPPEEVKYCLEKHMIKLDRELSVGLNTVVRVNRVTLNTLFRAVWGILLRGYNNSGDVVFGAVVSGRPADVEGIETMVGLFINTVPVRVTANGHRRFSRLLEELQVQAAAAKSYEYLPLAEIQSHSFLKQDLIDHIMVFENYPLEKRVIDTGRGIGTGFSGENLEIFEQTGYHFDIVIVPAECLTVTFSYNARVYDRDLVERYGNHLVHVLKQVAANPGLFERDIRIITEEEKQQILNEFNDTRADYPQNKTIHELFEEQAEKAPDGVAVFGKKEKMHIIYRVLNEKANQLAEILREKGVLADDIIAIMLDRSIEMIIGILGILKAGGAYLPIDAEYPEERKQYMLADSGVKLFITANEITALSHVSHMSYMSYPANNHLAYVIYTSGSTGRPRGVPVEHCSLVAYLCAFDREFSISPGDVMLQQASFSFDAFGEEVYPLLFKGGRVVIAGREEVRDVDRLVELIVKHDVNILDCSPLLLNELNRRNMLRPRSTRPYLFISGGDVLKYRYIGNLLAIGRVYNTYGPTEATICATYYCCDEKIGDSVPIGKPIANYRVYIMDKAGNFQPVGVTGELYITGPGVTRGYLNNPELTNQKLLRGVQGGSFLEKSPPGRRRHYKTGDLARWLPDGNIEFIGRVDHQVKIRGYRIELGEIESHLAKHEDMHAVVVSARETDLCVYFTAGVKLSAAHLREYLANYLPAYMIPAYFMQLETISLTPGGKIDKKALPGPGTGTAAGNYEAPRGYVEEKLLDVWQEVLGYRGIGINDNFFEIGGDSIKAIQVAARLRTHGLGLRINQLFLNSTIKTLSKTVTRIERSIPQGIVEGQVELTPIQHWFFRSDCDCKAHFNQAVVLYRAQGFAEDSLKRVLTKIAIHHDALRMVYEINEKGVIQVNQGINGKLFDFEVMDFTGNKTDIEKNIAEEIDRVQQGINLKTGPLMKTALFKTSQGDHLLMVIHHLVVDGVSWRILLEDLAAGYTRAIRGEEITFPDKTDSFQHWARELNKYARGDIENKGRGVLKELEYWQAVHDEMAEAEPLPADREISGNPQKNKFRETLEIILEPEDTECLLRKANWAYNTEINDILLTGLGLALREWAGVQKICINLEGHGREPVIEGVDISRTVGWFTAQYPVILDIRKSHDISYAVKNVKETLRRVPDKGINYGILKYFGFHMPPAARGSFEKPPLDPAKLFAKGDPGVSFNYLGQVDLAVEDRDLFGFSRIGSGRNVSPEWENPYALDINGILKNGRLYLSIGFNQYRFEKGRVLELAEIYKSLLVQVIRHCAARDKKELTPSDLGYNKISLEDFSTILNHAEIQSLYPLSPMQSGMFYHTLKDKNSHAYFEQFKLTLKGEIREDLLEKSFNKLVERYDALRTNFVYEKLDKPLQFVLKSRQVRIHYEDISRLNASQRDAFLEKYRKDEWEQGFDLSRDMLMKLSLFRTGGDSYTILLSSHHIIMDGWCSAVVYEDLARFYGCLQEGEPIETEEVTPYREYIRWLEKQDTGAGLRYWQEYLEGYEGSTGVPRTRGLSAGDDHKPGYEVEEYSRIIDETRTSRLTGLAAAQRVTLSTVFRVLWALLLQRYNNTPDVVFGAVVSGRPAEIKGIENLVGLFVNTVPVRIRINNAEQQDFFQLLRTVRDDAISSQKYEYLPLADIQANALSRGDLIDHIMVFENYPVRERILHGGPGFRVENVEIYEQTNYSFNIIIIPGKCLELRFNYNNRVYDREFIKRVGDHLHYVIDQVIAAARQGDGDSCLTAAEIEMITENEKRRIMEDFNRTAADYSTEGTIRQLFEEQVEKTPDHIAVVGAHELHELHEKKGTGEKNHLTYRELNRNADQLAYLLREKGVLADDIVGIMIERSLEMVIGILGILKAGGAYLPIDPDFPRERIDYMLKDSNALLFLTDRHLELSSNRKNSVSSVPSVPSVAKNHLVYVIYTSGSTGKPKAVMLEHGTAVNLVKFQHRYTCIDFSSVLQFATIGFDVSFQEIATTLTRGGKLLVISREIRDNLHRLFKVVEDCQIRTLFLPASFLKFIAGEEEFLALIPSCVKHIVTAGEQVIVNERFRNYLVKNEIYLHNHYGPSETHAATTLTLEPGAEIPMFPPIGRPIMNSRLYIVDSAGYLQPVGVSGELYISGVPVGRGYLNRPELTNKKFCGGPGGGFSKEPPGRRRQKIYKTGDLCRWLPDGNIEFLGRIDHQVKVRGFRVELGEIESELLKLEKIKDAVVLARQDGAGQNYLCAYIVSQGGVEYPGLRETLSRRLPDYMVPGYVVSLERIPLTPNGKPDRKALPEPGLEAVEGAGGYTAPVNDIEETLAELWSEILSMDKNKIGTGAGFFELGGHSLKAFAMVSRIHKAFNIDVPLETVFSRPTIRELAEYIAGAAEERFVSILPAEQKEYYPLSPAQKRLYIIQEMDKTNVGYNLPQTALMEGELSKERLEETFQRLIRRHESLRTSFEMFASEPIQRIHEDVEFEIDNYTATEATEAGGTRNPKEEKGEEKGTGENLLPTANCQLPTVFVRPFDLSRAPLVRVGLIKLDDREHLFMMDMHHIISDGISEGILIKEFMTLSRGLELPVPRLRYKDYVEWLCSKKEKEAVKQQEQYWLNRFAGEIPVLDLPLDYVRPAVQDFAGAVVSFEMEKEQVGALRELALKEDVTLYMVLLAIFYVFLAKLSGDRDIVIGTPLAGRRHADLRDIIGMFVNTLALRNSPIDEKTFTTFLGEIKQNVLEAFENQEYPFEELVEKTVKTRDTGRNPLFDVMFAFHDIGMTGNTGELEVPGLKLKPHPLENKTAHFDWTLTGIDAGDILQFTVEYRTTLFKPETVQRFTGYLQRLVLSILENPGKSIRSLDILPEKEKQRVLVDFNDTRIDYPQNKTVHELFEEQAKKTPDGVVLVGSEQGVAPPTDKGAVSKKEKMHIIYKVLNENANQLACLLRERGVLADDIIAIMSDRSVEMIIGILGILKAGGAYLPIDPDYPEERKQYMLADSGVRLLINGNEMSVLSHLSHLSYMSYPSKNHLAYIIYTSGSTGKPKGVMIRHGSLVNQVFALRKVFDFDASLHDMLIAPFIFDVSIMHIFLVLTTGAKLFLVPDEVNVDPMRFRQFIIDNRIDVFDVVPGHLSVLLNGLKDKQIHVKYLFVGGEVLTGDLYRRIKEVIIAGKIINSYGPTEGTINTTLYECADREEGDSIPIGGPLMNYRVYILDRGLNPVPVGVKGELCIGGAGIAVGYLNRPELTMEKFFGGSRGAIFQKSPPGRRRLYRTGDLARWLADGNIEFLGRVDFQVKIRGFRIELGEIESQLSGYVGIKEAVVVHGRKKSGENYLCAYFTAGEGLEVLELRAYLARRLPGYMIPAYFVPLDRIPLGPNGKLDRKRLPPPGIREGGTYVTPGSDREKIMAAVWKEVLELDRVGVEDNFFELGGNSLDIIRLGYRLNGIFKTDIPVLLLFRYPTIRSLSVYLDGEAEKLSDKKKQIFSAIDRGKQKMQKRRKIGRGVKNGRDK